MPLTPFHLGFAWPAWLFRKRKLHFICLSFGAMVPDLEVLWMSPFAQNLGYARGYLHSFYGALTIDIAITLFVAYLIVPPIGRWLRRRARKGSEDWHIFAGVDVGKAPKYHGWAVFSALLGAMSHVVIDTFTHLFNPIFWPYMLDRNINLMPFEDTGTSTFLFMIPFGIIVTYMALRYWTKGD